MPLPNAYVSAMKLVYTHPSHIIVSQARSALDMAGIKCSMRNEYASGALGELAPIDTWPELWVMRDRDYEMAARIVEQLSVATQEADWQCAQCGNASPATFDSCWHCAGERYASIAP